jgi:hypothetical protein
MIVFKGNDKASFFAFLDDTKCMLKLAYLADIYRHLNTLNALFHNPKESILTSSNKTVALFKKTCFLDGISAENELRSLLAAFPGLESFQKSGFLEI